MKKILLTLAVLFTPVIAYAAFAIPWSATSTNGFLFPTQINGSYLPIQFPYLYSTSTSLSTFNGTVQAPIQDNGGQVYNVKSFGAVGNGVHDDTQAIQNALDAATSTSPNQVPIVYLPQGTYIISKPIWIDSVPLTIEGAGTQGAGTNSTILKANNNTINMFMYSTTTDLDHLTFKSMSLFSGTQAGFTSTSTGSAIYADGGSQCADYNELDDMSISGWSYGFWAKCISNLTMRNDIFYSNATSTHFEGNTNSNNMINVSFEGNSGTGMELLNGQMTIIGGDDSGNTNNYYLGQYANLTIIGKQSEAQEAHDFTMPAFYFAGNQAHLTLQNDEYTQNCNTSGYAPSNYAVIDMRNTTGSSFTSIDSQFCAPVAMKWTNANTVQVLGNNPAGAPDVQLVWYHNTIPGLVVGTTTANTDYPLFGGNATTPSALNRGETFYVPYATSSQATDQLQFSVQKSDGTFEWQSLNQYNIDKESSATTTWTGPLHSPCFSTDGSTCIGGGSGSGTVNSGTTGQSAYYASNGTAVSGTSTIFVGSGSLVGISSTSPQAVLSIGAKSTGNTPVFEVSSSTGAVMFQINPTGNTGFNVAPIGSQAISIYDNTSGVNAKAYIGSLGCGAGTIGFQLGNSTFDCAHYAFSGDQTNLFLNAISGGYIAFRIANGDYARLNSTGFGVGTTSPGTLLSLGNTGGINLTPTATSTFGSSANGINITNGCYAIGGTCVGGGSGSGTVNSGTASYMAFYQTSTNAVSATSSVNVGTSITLAPGGGTNTIGVSVPATNQIEMNFSNPNVDANSGLNLLYDNNVNFITNNTESGSEIWQHNGTENMRLTSGGNLGIGTTTPKTALDVNGAIYSEMASTTSFSYDFCTSNNVQNFWATSTNATINFTNASSCKGKSMTFLVVAPLSGVIGSTTFATNQGTIIWDGGINPGNSVIPGSTDRFVFTALATSTFFISADLTGTF